jgi:zinc transport system substrate-binding protein
MPRGATLPASLGWTVLLGLVALACSPAEPPPGGRTGDAPLHVVVSVPPQAYLVERIGGERVETEVLMRSGSSEETFSPSPRQMVALSRADLYVLVGHPAFLVETRHVLPALERDPRVRVVDMSAGMVPGEAAPPAGHEDHDHAGGAGDPHVWTAPRLMRAAAETVAAALADLDPAAAALYRGRLASFLAELDALDAEIRRELSGLPRHRFLVTHPAWGHFAAEYGLEQVAIEEEGKEPSPARLVELVEAARAEGLHVIFTQAGFPDSAARAIANEIDGRVVPLDPLARDWPGNTRKTAQAIASALRAPTE